MAVLQILGLNDFCESGMGHLILGISQKVLLSCLGALYLYLLISALIVLSVYNMLTI